MRKQIQALGRLKTGQMNKTESAYCQHLELRKRAGEITWYRFEGIKLRLADNTFYTPDFAVMLVTGEMELHEVKGFWTDDARVKTKVAADQYICATDGGMPQTPATDAFLAEIRAEARNEGINYTASRLAAAFNHGFINKSLREVFDVTRMILSAKEELANELHPIDGLSGEYAEKSLEEWAEQIRKGVQS